jgi:hypothetical protein
VRPLLYLTGRWGSFSINLLEFRDISNIAGLAIQSTLGTLVIFAVAVGLAQVVNYDPPRPAGLALKIEAFVRRRWRPSVILYVVLILAVITFVREPDRWVLASLLACRSGLF